MPRLRRGRVEFPGQTIRASRTDGPGTDTVILGGSIDHQVRPALIAARADWTATHRTG